MEKQNFHKPQMIIKIIGMALVGLLIAMTMALLFGIVVKLLWNWLMPAIFGLTTITFWQAWGLLVLSHILFKSFPHSKPHYHERDLKKKLKSHFHPECWSETRGTNNVTEETH